METITIRSYDARDREDVRRLACDTADAGAPVELIFPDRNVFADLLTRYYTDFEPESSWVAERDDRVVGYLNGCLHPQRIKWRTTLQILPAILFTCAIRGLLWHPKVLRNLLLWMRPRPRMCNHLHINVSAEARGQHAGSLLLAAFLAQATAVGVRELRASVREDNLGGRRFFERHGFVAGPAYPSIRTDDGLKLAVIYVWREDDAQAPTPQSH